MTKSALTTSGAVVVLSAQLAEQKSVGERVEIGMPLFTLVDLDRLYVKIYVPEPSIGKVALGQEARVHVDAYPDRASPSPRA